MVVFNLAANKFSGGFPNAIYNFSSLEYLLIRNNYFSGSLRTDFGKLLPNLVELYMGYNYFKGAIPATLANISSLQKLLINDNNMTGSIPSSIGKLRQLQYVFLSNNFWVGDLQFLGALTNCTQLVTLSASKSRLGWWSLAQLPCKSLHKPPISRPSRKCHLRKHSSRNRESHKPTSAFFRRKYANRFTHDLYW